jgi:hypothetical protein
MSPRPEALHDPFSPPDWPMGILRPLLQSRVRWQERRLVGKRASSKLPELIELVISGWAVSAGMIAKELVVTPQAAQRIVQHGRITLP